MARIRTLKPEFHTNEQVMELSRDARLLFISMWNFCDDAGIHPASLKSLKARIFPSDDLTSADIQRLIDELIEQSLIRFYEVDKKGFWLVTGWHHQKIDKPSFKYPHPTENQHRSGLDEHSTNDSRTLDDDSPPEGRGRGRVRERKGDKHTPPPDAGAGAREDFSIPQNFTPKSEHQVLANNLGLNLTAEAEKFIDHYRANGESRADWDAQFKKWLRNAPKFGDSRYTGAGPPSGGSSGKQAVRDSYAAQAAEARERTGQHERHDGERDITSEAQRVT